MSDCLELMIHQIGTSRLKLVHLNGRQQRRRNLKGKRSAFALLLQQHQEERIRR